jgi:anti-sigma factor RsiW
MEGKCGMIKDTIIEYIYGELEPGKRALFEAHLKECPECAKLAAGYAKVREAFEKVRPEMTQEDFDFHRENTVAKINEPQPGIIDRIKSFLTVQKLAYAMAVLLLVAAGAGTGYYTSYTGKLAKEKAIAEKMDMLENMEIIERLDFYKQMSEGGINEDQKSGNTIFDITLFLRSGGC